MRHALPLLVLAGVTQLYGLLAAATLRGAVVELYCAPFSRRRFYALMGWAPLTFVALGVLFDVRYLAYFVVAAVAGVAGELLLSVLWRSFFREPIWTYGYGARASGYTSTLNVLPWAIGGLFFQVVGRLVHPEPAPLRPMLVSAAAFAVAFPLAWALRAWSRPPDGGFSRRGLLLFCLPIAATAGALAVACSPRYLPLMALFAVVGTLTEYAYGRAMSTLFERPLWTYNHGQLDGGHTSYVTLPLWALGGLYFHFLAATLGL